MKIVDAFAGPGGWDEALRDLGRSADVLGIEYDSAACATRLFAGHHTLQADFATLDPEDFADELEGFIASPPCQGFSAAGKGAARNLLPELLASIHARRWHDRADPDPRVWLIVDLGRWLSTLTPEWVALEQVPAVLPIWEAYGDLLRERGYSVWTGILNSADFGVPQTRQRAILIASRVKVAHPPEPTHDRAPVPSLFGTLEPWVTMAEALPHMAGRFAEQRRSGERIHEGFDADTQPADTVTTRADRWQVGFPRLDDRGDSEDGYRERDWRDADEPSFAFTEKARSWTVRTALNPDDERDGHEPAPTVTTRADQWELNTGRAWPDGGTREDAQKIDPQAAPAPTLTAKSGGQWQLRPGSQTPTVRNDDEPAPTLAFGHSANDWVFDRPATTLMGDPRVFSPGGHIANDGRNNENMVGRSENAIRITVRDALILQSFRPDYPVQGTKTKQFEQVGNAIPPRLAWHVLRTVL